MKQYYFNGQLILDEKIQNKMNYIIIDKLTKEQTSLSNLLDNIFNSTNSIAKLVRVLGRIQNNITNKTEPITGMGNLLMCRDKSHAEGYCIGSLQLDYMLFENVGNDLELLVEDYTNFVFTEATISNDKAKSIS